MTRFVSRALLNLLAICAGLGYLHAQKLPALIPYRMKSGWGYCDSNMKLRIAGPFTSAEPFVDGRARVRLSESQPYSFLLIDSQGSVLTPNLYWNGRADSGHPSLNVVDSTGRWGMINERGNLVVPCLYDNPVQGFKVYRGLSSSALIAARSGLFGVVDAAGTVLVPFEFDEVSAVTVSVANYPPDIGVVYGSLTDSILYWSVRDGARYGAYSPDGGLRFAPAYDAIYPSGALAAVRLNGRMGIIDSTGKILLPIKFDSTRLITTVGGQILQNGKWGWWYAGSGRVLSPRFENPVKPLGRFLSSFINRVCLDPYGNEFTQQLQFLTDSSGQTIFQPTDAEYSAKGDSIVSSTYIQLADGRIIYFRCVLDPTSGSNFPQWTDTIPYPKHYKRCWELYPVAFEDAAGWQQNGYIMLQNRFWMPTGSISTDAIQYRSGSRYEKMYGMTCCSHSEATIVDSTYQFHLEKKTQSRIVGGNFRAGWLAIDTGSTWQDAGDRWAIADTAMRRLTPFIRSRILDCYRYQGRLVLLGLRNPVPYKSEGRSYPRGFGVNCPTLIDSAGQILPGFERLCNVFPIAWKRNAATMAPGDGIFSGRDSAGRTGLITISGKIINRKMSFKRQLDWHSENVIGDGDRILNSRGRPYFGNRNVSCSWSGEAGRQGLLSVYETGDTKQPFCYMDAEGRIYADAALYKAVEKGD